MNPSMASARRGPAWRGLVLSLLVVAAVGARAAGQDSDDLKRQREAQRRSYEQHHNRLKSLGSMTMDDLCQVAQERGELRVLTKMPATRPGQYRVKVEGVDGLVSVSMDGQVRDGQPQSLNLQVISFNDPDKVQISTNLSCNSGILSLSRSGQTVQGGYYSVSLQQVVAGPENVGMCPGVTFLVQEMDGGRMRVNLNAQAPDFMSLRRQHARQIDEHLRPVLREMRLESLMAPDPIVAWQVFADQWQADEKITARIAAVLPRLDADDFGVREAALAELRQAGKAGALAVLRMKRDTLTAQQNTLLDTFLADYQTMPASDTAALRKDREFLLDCLYSDEAAIRASALKSLGGLGVKIALAPDANLDARAQAVDQVRRGATTTPASRPTTAPSARDPSLPRG